ncbi:hypothetical protein OSSY52_14820 [Tepiditoga spiralis]|uniref:HEPN AbiJ-N-terminal domain-containing protein n=1 Tax=Tepiditoga spiralis TaxID=2108365 RepID=A0A7G1G4N6_9BACT|nr:hypothetical protein [Tepiditoga spiralis]BBE31341.1 hypothetical protein OSSY52_14820 [Tepiditoga spiralis]
MPTFSERYKYIKENQIPYDKISKKLRNRLWNKIYPLLENEKLTKKILDDFFKINLYEFKENSIEFINNEFKKLEFHEVYSLIEFILKNHNYDLIKFKDSINKIFIEEKAQYRITGKQIVKLISSHEMKEIDKVFETEDLFLPVRKNIFKGLDSYLNHSYENSIDCSLKAIEEVCKIVFHKEGTLNTLIDEIPINTNYKLFFKNLSINLSYEDARLMLVTCSAFVNYIISKFWIN